MTFLNPAILWALAAISIPILIHIFNLKRTKKVEISTLMFLKEIQQSKYKRIKLKQLLILLCRIAFITALVLMFAIPFDNGYLGSAGEKARSSVLIILDDSFSMQARDANGNNFDNAKRKIIETLDILDQNDEVFFTTVSGINRLQRLMLFKDITKLKDTLNTLKTSDITKDFNTILYFSGEILKSASNSNKEIYYFTDGQKSTIENSSVFKNASLSDPNTKFNIVLTGSRDANNISIDTVNTISKIFEKNKSVKIKTVINNHNNFNVTNKSVMLNFGSSNDEKVIDIPANSSVDVEFAFIPGVTGFAGGVIELSQSEITDDEISSDNRQYFELFIPQKISLLLVSGSPKDISYIDLAISSSEDLMTDSLGRRSTYFDIKRISSGEFSGQDLASFNSVVIVNKSGFTDAESQKIKKYIDDGGGVIIYPGNLMNADSYNSNLFKVLDIPFIAGRFTSGDGNNSLIFDKVDLEHPVFEGIFKKGTGDKKFNLESPGIKSGINLSTGENSIAPVKLNNEKNFMVEYSKGKGKLIVFAVSPDMVESDYPAKNLFSPVTVRSILYLANINNISPAVTGKDYFIDPSKFGNVSDTLKLTSYHGSVKEENIIPLTDRSSLVDLKNYNGSSGNYSISSGGKELFKYACIFDNRESTTGRYNSSELQKYTSDSYGLSVNIIEPAETISAEIVELRTGKEIWQYFLILGLIFLCIEFFLARSAKKTVS